MTSKVWIIKNPDTGDVVRNETGVRKGKAYRFFYQKSAASQFIVDRNLVGYKPTQCSIGKLDKSYFK